jgi:hypothetical protein
MIHSIIITTADQLEDFLEKLKEIAEREFHLATRRNKSLIIYIGSIPPEWNNKIEFVLCYSHKFISSIKLPEAHREGRVLDQGKRIMYPFIEEYLYQYRAARIFEFEKARISIVE